MDLQLENKVYLIAGASKGLGYAIAERLLKEGARVSISGSDEERITAAAGGLSALGEVHHKTCDVKDTDAISAWVASAHEQFGQIDGLVVNAGGPPPGSFDDFADEDWVNAFNLTLMSSVRMIRAVLPHMRERKSGSILTLTSSSVKEPIDFLLLSNVMRSGVTSLAKSLSRSEVQYGIRVNNLVPGLIATDRMKNLDRVQAEANGRTVKEQHAFTASQIPMGRYGNPDEFADAAAFLLSESASYITGATLICDGGTMKTLF